MILFKNLRFIIISTFFGLFSAATVAVVDGHKYQFEDPAKQALFKRVTETTRCPKCLNQNVADSDAITAAQIRDVIYEQVQAGKSEIEINEYLVARYGEFVNYNPGLSSKTLMLWFGPLFLLILAIIVVYFARRIHLKEKARTIDADAQAKLDDLLATDSATSANKSEKQS